MHRRTMTGLIVGWFVIAGLLAGCGGGGGDSQVGQVSSPSGEVTVFAWKPPATFNDNTPLNPTSDIDYYELYIRTDPNFTESDQPAVQIAAMTDLLSTDGKTVVKSPVTEFTLELVPSIPSQKILYVSMKAVGIDKQKSAFMAPLTWDRS